MRKVEQISHCQSWDPIPVLLKYEASTRVRGRKEGKPHLYTGMSECAMHFHLYELSSPSKTQGLPLVPFMGCFPPQEGRHSMVPFVTKIPRDQNPSLPQERDSHCSYPIPGHLQWDPPIIIPRPTQNIQITLSALGPSWTALFPIRLMAGTPHLGLWLGAHSLLLGLMASDQDTLF